MLLQELFKRVVPHQCLGAVWARRARKQGQGGTVAGSVLATIEQFNRVSLRVIATILKNSDLKTSQRVKILQKWIEIAQVGRLVHNIDLIGLFSMYVNVVGKKNILDRSIGEVSI